MIPLHHTTSTTLGVQTQIQTQVSETLSPSFQFGPLNPSKSNATFKFTFSPASPSPCLPYRSKRTRPLSDVDGNLNANTVNEGPGRKKRRLRLHLITSRLSRPFSVPASYKHARVFGMRGVSVKGAGGVKRLGVYGGDGKGGGKKEIGIERNVLRKVAIFNRIRLQMRMHGARESTFRERKQQTLLDVDMHLREILEEKQNKRWNESVLPPSPLGRSNYDVLDSEDEMLMDELEDGCEKTIYSDFNIMCSSEEGEDEYDYLDTLDGLSPEDMQEQPLSPPEDERIVEMLKEEERLYDSYFVCAGGAEMGVSVR
ncbi:uncharacterized protein EAF01_003666 [Botrytis porri]|uniref:Uncharacterized protein n=1 Tax=Botrytis porri TaxID=87229 RepID=A0A4Z1KGC4_9HELO|nr:uncharacterized protein EAF01_003666 [Botrytis porri]KAF7909948.1 hypothetical protein EAF01_003666 [Botrytis porri]TGO84610.1 hypothetical protein BPOR_0486g00110 [Botrytis porri]